MDKNTNHKYWISVAKKILANPREVIYHHETNEIVDYSMTSYSQYKKIELNLHTMNGHAIGNHDGRSLPKTDNRSLLTAIQYPAVSDRYNNIF